MTAEKTHPNYVAIWIWLVVLLLAGVFASFLPLTKSLSTVLIFVVAVTKALLVVLNYMHLKFESRLIYAMAIVPVALVFGLTLLLFPDFVFRH